MKYSIKVADTDITYICSDDESMFNAMHKSGRSIFKGGCAGGGCGVCKVQILEGEYEKFKKMSRAHVSEEEEAQGIVLACCVKPLGDIVLSEVDK